MGRRTSTWQQPGNTGDQGRIYWDNMLLGYRAQDGTTYFEHQDWLNTTRMRTDYQGNIAATFSSLPFGDGSASTLNKAAAGQDNTHFADLDLDNETNTDHATFRQYGNIQGRWMSPDPYYGSYDSSNPQSMDRYGYVLNDPLVYVDPDGTTGSCDGTGSDCEEPCADGCDLGGAGGGQSQTQQAMVTFMIDAWDIPPQNLANEYFLSVLGTPQNLPMIFASSGSGTGGPSNAPSNAPTNSTCQATLLSMANQQLGTNFNSSNIDGSYTNGTAYNIIIQSNQLTSAQFNNIQQGRYTTSGWQYLTGVGLAGHIADETNLGFAQSAFQSSNIGGNLSVSFAFHDDNGYANNPIGALIHWITDVLGHNTRKPC